MAPEILSTLVERFERNLESYRSGAYNETQVRNEFINPFFEALGWDVQNKLGYAEAYKDVIHEDAVKIGTATKAPDYSFRIGGVRKFFLEAKKPSVNIAEEISPAYQLRRYAWSANLPLSILTDFEEFAIYDCRTKPKPTDKASIGRVMYLKFSTYEEKWDEIASIFSKDAVMKGSFDKYAQKGGRGTAQVDKEFLREIENWREELAKNIALRNKDLSVRDLNFSVQRIIDRIIFLRMCEDRGIELYGKLQQLMNGQNTYARLRQFFDEADAKYNSGLFHFRKEKDRHEPPDELTPSLTIDDKVLKSIIGSLYYPASPYEFSVLGADILGNVYEQFLGKVIRLTPSHQAKVEDKPEVKKAGGVYYTPKYIVDYIVKNTVGKLCDGKTPKEVSKLRILDPACGSGSFLIGAYQYLLDWHRDWYVNDGVTKHTKVIYQAAGSEWRLTTVERKRILLNNIYGVDIDTQAVETTKLSLLLKVLEGENEQTLSKQFKLFHERALPDLGNNIKCGNSLIGPDFYEGQIDMLDDEERYRINAFDWKSEFKSIMDAGGFDAVIGNPPYILQQTLNQRSVFYYLSSEFHAARYKIDTYHVFFEKGLELTVNRGKLGYITPNTFLRNKHARELRNLMLSIANIDLLRVFYYPVFQGASVDTSITILSKAKNPNAKHRVEIIRSKAVSDPLHSDYQSQKNWYDHPTQDFSFPGLAGSDELATKIFDRSSLLGDFATAYFGIQTFDRARFVKSNREAKHFKPAIDGANIQRYMLLPSMEFVDFRPEAIKSGGKRQVYEQTRIGVRQIGEVPIAVLVPSGIYSLNTIYNVFFTKQTNYKLQFILGLMCSKALRWYWRHSFFDNKETFPKVKKDALLSIPIPKIDFDQSSEKASHDRVVLMVERMMALHKQLASARTPHERSLLQRQIDATDKQIDKRVYELYGLMEEEIKIVEGE